MSDTFQSVFMCPPEPKNDSRYVCCALGMPGNARRAWVALPASRAAAYPRTVASTALRSAALGPVRTVPAAPPPPSSAEAPETVLEATAGPGVAAPAGAGLGAAGGDSALTVAAGGAATDSGIATGVFVLLPRPVFLAGAVFFPPAGFGSGRLSAIAGSDTSWETTGAGAATGGAGAVATAAAAPVSDGAEDAGAERLRRATLIATRATSSPPPASASESGELCRRTMVSGAAAASVGLSAVPDAVASAAPMGTAPVRGVDESGAGVRISGIGLLGVLTPI